MYVILIDGENECNSRVKSEEITVVEDEALQWSTTSRLGGLMGTGTRRNEERVLYMYTKTDGRWATGDERKYAWAPRDEMLINY